MKNPLILSLLALIVSVVGFGTLLLSSFLTEPGRAPAPLPVVPSPDGELLARVEALSEENRALRDRLSMLELQPAPARSPAGLEFVSQEEFDAFREEVLEALGGRKDLAKGTFGEPEVLKEQVASTLTEIRRDEAARAAQKKLESRATSLAQAMPKYEEWLQLTPKQSQEMQSALLAQYEREMELTRRWKEGEDPEVLGELKRTDRQTTRDELSGILTPTQLETFLSRTEAGGKGARSDAGNAGRGGRGK